ncbi:DUF1289 domain-containing protein [Alkalimonas collagenimarina]|uniref:DUF1289 domain-containing protein n=1 Tax=Alkalimonas collagenimarina TaxID=400390 RepID=A0ABT9GY19_9GAMM|nr:DUF1289 domain-containing protein [Alkalimonas collagenimarina]MDP4535949.1 DUF1289 domain-containing protein [Alkalimonas collagenimarina]
MDQLELFDLPNPCIGVCESNNRGYCKGCLRSREERFNWPQKPAVEKARILKLLAQRQKRRQAKSQSGHDRATNPDQQEPDWFIDASNQD